MYPAIAGAILGTTRWFCRGRADRVTGAILFLSAAAGGLSKLSYLVIFLPMAAMALRVAPAGRRNGLLAMGGGLLLISPWWLFNWRDALHYASYASGFVRHEYPWFTAAVHDLIGVPFSVGLAVALLVCVRSARSASSAATTPARALVVTCLAGLLPLLVLHVMGDNHNMRLLTPAWILIVGIVVLLLDMAGAFERPLGRGMVALTLVAQAVVLAVTVGTQVELQRDWRSLKAFTGNARPEEIRIAHLGDTSTLNSPQILFAWRRTGESIDLDRLWRWESGPIPWDGVLARADSADIVVVPLDLALVNPKGKDDNANNLEFTMRLLEQGNAWTVDTLPRTPADSNRYLLFVRRAT